jgi:hypothetical protein
MIWAALQAGESMLPFSARPASGALFSFPKRKLSPLRRACLSLGLPVDARPRTNMARLLRNAGLGSTAIEYLRFSEDEQARRIVELYYSLKNATERKATTIDYLILAAGADVHRVSGLIQEWVSRIKEDRAMLLACMNAPELIQKTIKRAKTPEGHKDRELIFRIVGVLPVSGQPGLLERLRRKG